MIRTLRQIEFLSKLADLIDEYDVEISITGHGEYISIKDKISVIFEGHLDKCWGAEKIASWEIRSSIDKEREKQSETESSALIPVIKHDPALSLSAIYQLKIDNLHQIDNVKNETENFNKIYRERVKKEGLKLIHALEDDADFDLYPLGYPMQAHMAKDGDDSWPAKTYLSWN